jgi:hypothetical protein
VAWRAARRGAQVPSARRRREIERARLWKCLWIR